VTLTVTDRFGQSTTTQVLVSLNNTPPRVSIVSPVDRSTFCAPNPEVIQLLSSIQDDQHGAGELVCEWNTVLHHDIHTHPEPPVSTCEASAVINAHGDVGDVFYFEFVLTVTDAAGLSTTARSSIYPFCPCPADFTGDGFVDDADFVVFAAAYELFTVPPAAGVADLTGDGFVDDADFVVFAAAYAVFACP
jgi:hypothetical protein